MFRTAAVISTCLILSGCIITRDWEATGGSRADGVVRLSYEQPDMFQVKTDPDQARQLAKTRCAAWGYTDAEPFGGVIRTCNAPSGFGCNSYLVTAEYQCTGVDKK